MTSDRTPIHSESILTAASESSKVEESALHRGDFLEPNRPKLQTVRTLSGIGSLQLPANWYKIELNDQLSETAMFRPSTKDNTQISFYGSKRPLDKESQNAFSQAINSDLPTPRVIFSDKTDLSKEAGIQVIKELRNALGSTTIGDNQFTSVASRSPAFHMDTATVESINGKKVIAINGWFTQMNDHAEIKMDEHGPLKRRYNGIFFEVKRPESNEVKVKELYLQADDNISFASHKAAFRNVLKSIEWK